MLPENLPPEWRNALDNLAQKVRDRDIRPDLDHLPTSLHYRLTTWEAYDIARDMLAVVWESVTQAEPAR